MKSEKSVLKHCPFCGNNNPSELKVVVYKQENSKIASAVCIACEATGPVVWDFKIQHGTKKAREKLMQINAVELWNERRILHNV